MNIQEKMMINEQILKYTKLIWDDQLTDLDKEILYDIVNDRKCKNININFDSNLDYILYISYNASKNGYAGYNDEQIINFKNILRTYNFQKLSKIHYMSIVLKCLNENGIQPLLIKGVSLLSYYAKNIPRMMNDMDIYINPKQFDAAVSLILNLGFKFEGDNGFHVAVSSKELDIDIHRYIYKNHGDADSQIYDRLISVKFLGCDTFVLSREDMLLHQFINRGRDISTSEHLNRHLKWIIDCHYIIGDKKFNIKKLLTEAEKINNLYYARITILKYVELFPNSFDDKIVIDEDKKYASWLFLVYKNIHSIKYSMSDKGLKRLLFSLQYNYNRAKDVKYLENRKEPLFILILKLNNIYTLNDFANKFKKLLKRC